LLYKPIHNKYVKAQFHVLPNQVLTTVSALCVTSRRCRGRRRQLVSADDGQSGPRIELGAGGERCFVGRWVDALCDERDELTFSAAAQPSPRS
jgi:hypothetical protein